MSVSSREIRTGFQFHFAASKGSDAQLGALQIDQYRRRAIIGLFQRADVRDQLGFVGLFTVAHIDAESVCTGAEQLFDHLGRIAGGSQCREDTDLAHTRLVILHGCRSFALWILSIAHPITG